MHFKSTFALNNLSADSFKKVIEELKAAVTQMANTKHTLESEPLPQQETTTTKTGLPTMLKDKIEYQLHSINKNNSLFHVVIKNPFDLFATFARVSDLSKEQDSLDFKFSLLDSLRDNWPKLNNPTQHYYINAEQIRKRLFRPTENFSEYDGFLSSLYQNMLAFAGPNFRVIASSDLEKASMTKIIIEHCFKLNNDFCHRMKNLISRLSAQDVIKINNVLAAQNLTLNTIPSSDFTIRLYNNEFDSCIEQVLLQKMKRALPDYEGVIV